MNIHLPPFLPGIPLNHYLLLCLALFSIGVTGVLTRKNALIIFMSVELMLNAVNLLLTVFSVMRGDSSGQVFVFFIMAVAAAEVAIGLSIIVMIYRNMGSMNVGLLDKLKD